MITPKESRGSLKTTWTSYSILTITFKSSLHTLIVTAFWIDALKCVCVREYWIKAIDEST